MMTNKILIQIPFDGFYNSVTDTLLDDDVNYHIEQLQEENPGYNDYPDYSVDHVYIVKEYVKAYSSWLVNNDFPAIDLEYDSLSRSREYNFTTDRIFCYVSMGDIEKYYKAFMVNGNNQQVINDTFKSHDGFASFYNDFVDEWKNIPLSDWDHNQLMILLPEPNYWALWEDAQCNGVFNSAITFMD